MIFAGIVAGGKGTRMKSADRPKQFLEVGGVPILIRTIKAFLALEEIDGIYVGINPEWHGYADSLLKDSRLDTNKVKIINGGADRNGTIMKILDCVTRMYGANAGDILLTHDAVRPFVTERIIRENIDCAAKFSACGTYIPSADTVIKSCDGKTVEKNLVRSELYRAQTPQSFDIKKLCECCEKLGEAALSQLTDACGIFTACGIPIRMVEGDDVNFKITTDFDLAVAEGIASRV